MALQRTLIVSAIAVGLSGCAVMPDVTATYNFPRAETKLVATQTLGCNADNTKMVSALDVTATTTYVSDPDPHAQTGVVAYSGFGGTLKDTDLTLSFTPDHRLLGVNTSNTGEGETVIKDAVSLASALATVAFIESNGNPPPTPKAGSVQEDCGKIANFAGIKSAGGGGGLDEGAPNLGQSTPKKVVTLTYTANILYDPAGGKRIWVDPVNSANTYPGQNQSNDQIELIVDPDSATIRQALTRAKHPIVVKVDSVADIKTGVTWVGHDEAKQDDKAPDGFSLLKLNRDVVFNLSVWGPDKNFDTTSVAVWRGQLTVPIQKYYNLLVPSGVTFGKQQFTLALSDSGSITKLEYATNTGASDVLSAGGSIANAFPTTSSKATEAQNQADLIYQQQRLVLCKADSSTCASK